MPQQTLTAFNYMIAGYTKNGELGQSLNLFRRLVLCSERPDGYTFSMVLKALSCGNWCRIGKEVHGQIVKSCVVENSNYEFIATSQMDIRGTVGVVGGQVGNKLVQSDIQEGSLSLSDPSPGPSGSQNLDHSFEMVVLLEEWPTRAGGESAETDTLVNRLES
nr:hypothetical protein [Tanacetum cinerariifolium]